MNGGGGWSEFPQMLSDLKRYLRVDEIFELGQDALPNGLLDIRGQIENEPTRVVGYIDHRAFIDLPMYFGITSESDPPQAD